MSDASGAVSRLGCLSFVPLGISIEYSREQRPIFGSVDIVSAMHGSNHKSSRYNSSPQYYYGYLIFTLIRSTSIAEDRTPLILFVIINIAHNDSTRRSFTKKVLINYRTQLISKTPASHKIYVTQTFMLP